FLAPRLGMGTRGLENFVFHFLNMSFIAMSLRGATHKAKAKNVFSTVTTILSQFSLQSLLGLGLTFFFIATIFKDLFPTFGLFVTLGYCLGPGQAFSMGSGWESYGFEGAGTVGLTFGALGFLWAFFGGIVLVNHAKRKGWIAKEQLADMESDDVKRGIIGRSNGCRPSGAGLTTMSQAIDSLAYNIAVVFAIYLVAFLSLKLLSWLLAFAGPMGVDLANSFWSVTFIFCALFALLVKKLFRVFRADHTLDDG
ncbi:unnamed protein product, partial [marine sediment metagenome]